MRTNIVPEVNVRNVRERATMMKGLGIRRTRDLLYHVSRKRRRWYLTFDNGMMSARPLTWYLSSAASSRVDHTGISFFVESWSGLGLLHSTWHKSEMSKKCA
jgi:hypothetical protein